MADYVPATGLAVLQAGERVLPAASMLDADITDALAELRGARADFDRCPSGANKHTVEYAELRLNRLLERRHATHR